MAFPLKVKILNPEMHDKIINLDLADGNIL